MDVSAVAQTFILMSLKDILPHLSFFHWVLLGGYILASQHMELAERLWKYLYSFIKPVGAKLQLKLIVREEMEAYYTRRSSSFTPYAQAILWKYHQTYKNKKEVTSGNIPDNCAQIYINDIKVDYKPHMDDRFVDSVTIPLHSSNRVDLSDEVYVYFDIRETSKNGTKDKGDGKTGEVCTVVVQNIALYICTNSKPMSWLQTYMNQLVEQYSAWYKSQINHPSLYVSIPPREDKKEPSVEYYKFTSTKTFDSMFFDGKEQIIRRIEEYQNEAKYQRLGLPHTLGMLFYGEPGCGKTSAIKAIAAYMNRDIVCVNMSHLTNINQLRELFMRQNCVGFSGSSNLATRGEKRIYVFEEIDDTHANILDNPFIDRAIKDKIKQESSQKNHLVGLMNELSSAASGSTTTKNTTSSEKQCQDKKERCITVGDMLEVLDGLAEAQDRVIIFTTNHPEKIDPALKRPGRIDLVLEFKKLRRVDIDNMYKFWFNKSIPEDKLAQIEDCKLTQAQLGKLFIENSNQPDEIVDKLITA